MEYISVCYLHNLRHKIIYMNIILFLECNLCAELVDPIGVIFGIVVIDVVLTNLDVPTENFVLTATVVCLFKLRMY